MESLLFFIFEDPMANLLFYGTCLLLVILFISAAYSVIIIKRDIIIKNKIAQAQLSLLMKIAKSNGVSDEDIDSSISNMGFKM